MIKSIVMFRTLKILCLSFVLFSTCVYSAQNGFEVMSFRPATDNSRYLGLWDSNVLDKGEWFFGTTFDYSVRPLQITRNGEREYGVLDKVFEQHIFSSVGLIKDKLEIGIDVPIGWMLNYKDPNVTTSTASNKTALGDVVLNAKVRFLDINESKVGLALEPFVSLPTGKSDYYFGNGVFSAGANLIAEVNPIEKVFVVMNLGLLGKKNYTLKNIDDASKLTGGLGLGIEATKRLDVYADLLFKTRLPGVFKEQSETPLELLTGVKYKVANTGFVLNGAIGGGLINGAGAPQYRVIFGLGYSLPSSAQRGVVVQESAEPQTKPANISVIYFAFDSAIVENDIKIAEELIKDATKKFVIEGNADNVGPKSANDRISKRRAEAVAKRINKKGVEMSRMTIKAYGSSNPIADNKTKEGRKLNRRVEVKVQEELK